MQGEQNVVWNVEGFERSCSGRPAKEGGCPRAMSGLPFEGNCFQSSPGNKRRMINRNVKGFVDLWRPSCVEQSDTACIVTVQYDIQCDPTAVEQVDNVGGTVSQTLTDEKASVPSPFRSSGEHLKNGNKVNDLPPKKQRMMNRNIKNIIHHSCPDCASLLLNGSVHHQA